MAPAGDEAAFFAAVHSGADAVYLGLTDFSARKSAVNFSVENLKKYTDHAHALGVRVHVALNTLVKEGELAKFFECARLAWNAGADALIVQDIFLGKILKETYPEMVLHLSTQAGVCNLYGARLAKRYGFSRVILARETPFDGIAAIAREIETEVFVQGALCTCFSGQCYLSACIGGNSGNRGRCKQPCRKKYSIDRRGFGEPTYRLSLSDLSLGEDVKKLAAAGVRSFKIEGRMRSASYVGAAVAYYRDIFDGTGDLAADLSDLKRAYNRGDYTKGYVFGQDKKLISSAVQGHKGERVGTLERANGKYVFVRSSFAPSDGDGFKIIRGETEVGGGAYSSAFPRGKGGFFLSSRPDYRDGDVVYLTNDTALAGRVAARRKTVPLEIALETGENIPIKIKVRGKFGEREFVSPFVCESAKTRGLSEKDFEECFCKTDLYPFCVSVKVKVADSPFAVKSALNAFRRDVYAAVWAELAGGREELAQREVRVEGKKLPPPTFSAVAILDDPSLLLEDCDRLGAVVFAPKNYKNPDEFDEFFKKSQYYAWHKYLYLPAFMTDSDIDAVKKNVPLGRFDGVYAEGTWAIGFCAEQNLKLFAGTGFGFFNSLSLSEFAKEDCVETAALSKELSAAESEGLAGFRLAGGAIKVMELGHCPFSKTCVSCDKKDAYVLTDEAGRRFPLRRYVSGGCRFELFNCAALVPQTCAYHLYDLRTLCAADARACLRGERIASATQGLVSSGVL